VTNEAPTQGYSSDAAERAAHGENNKGLIVIVILTLLTVLEFVVAIAIDDTLGLILGLTPFALIKAGLIFWFFMHVYKLWKGEEDHA
jgi:heme/copper-type cytochrome/quinol oxidase subunit 4